MRLIIIIVIAFLVALGVGFSTYACIAISLSAFFAVDLFLKVNEKIALVEFILVLYSINYLFSPALAYQDIRVGYAYNMRITEETYFEIAIPAMLLLWLGLSLIRTKIFTFNVQELKNVIQSKQSLLKSLLVGGIILSLASNFVPGELGFIVYIISLLRFVAGISLFILDWKKYKWHLFALFFFEISSSLSRGMFHDTIIWLIFFGLVGMYLFKPHFINKILLCTLALSSYIVLQTSKSAYRLELTEGGAGLSTFVAVAKQNISSGGGLFSEENSSNAINRVNQAWIFASTMNRMNAQGDFQGSDLVGKYLEAAILPRYLAPDKLKAGDNAIFNKFSGHFVLGGTSMGLGIFADGYISFGYFGTLIFAFLFGLLIKLVCRVIEHWREISLINIFLIFPILLYAVRPDCETQTFFAHIFKSVIVYAIILYIYRSRLRTTTGSYDTATQQSNSYPLPN